MESILRWSFLMLCVCMTHELHQDGQALDLLGGKQESLFGSEVLIRNKRQDVQRRRMFRRVCRGFFIFRKCRWEEVDGPFPEGEVGEDGWVEDDGWAEEEGQPEDTPRAFTRRTRTESTTTTRRTTNKVTTLPTTTTTTTVTTSRSTIHTTPSPRVETPTLKPSRKTRPPLPVVKTTYLTQRPRPVTTPYLRRPTSPGPTMPRVFTTPPMPIWTTGPHTQATTSIYKPKLTTRYINTPKVVVPRVPSTTDVHIITPKVEVPSVPSTDNDLLTTSTKAGPTLGSTSTETATGFFSPNATRVPTSFLGNIPELVMYALPVGFGFLIIVVSAGLCCFFFGFGKANKKKIPEDPEAYILKKPPYIEDVYPMEKEKEVNFEPSLVIDAFILPPQKMAIENKSYEVIANYKSKEVVPQEIETKSLKSALKTSKPIKKVPKSRLYTINEGSKEKI